MADEVNLDQEVLDKNEKYGEEETPIEEETDKKSGCSHYKCRCAYITPCCDKEYACRVCHDEVEKHEIDRFLVTQIVCLLCRHRQHVSNTCVECNVTFGKYFCGICRMFDDNEKGQFHCDLCGICRVGGKEKFFHCDKCDLCLDNSLKESHTCISGVSRDNCSVCLEDLHSSRNKLAVFPCGHICHNKCRIELLKSGNLSCPLCCRSIIEMGSYWLEIDNEIQNVPMPEEYQNTKVWILCRDCHQVCETAFHVLGLKCMKCGSYNTCREAEPNQPSSPIASTTTSSTVSASLPLLPTQSTNVVSASSDAQTVASTNSNISHTITIPNNTYPSTSNTTNPSTNLTNTSQTISNISPTNTPQSSISNSTIISSEDLSMGITTDLLSTSSNPPESNPTLSISSYEP